jgi:hypothetical protein
MTFFKWLCNLIVILFFIGLMLRIGAISINILLLICISVFTLDLLVTRKKHT